MIWRVARVGFCMISQNNWICVFFYWFSVFSSGGPNDEKWNFEWILIDTNLFINDVIQSIRAKWAHKKTIISRVLRLPLLFHAFVRFRLLLVSITVAYICTYNFPNHQKIISHFCFLLRSSHSNRHTFIGCDAVCAFPFRQNQKKEEKCVQYINVWKFKLKNTVRLHLNYYLNAGFDYHTFKTNMKTCIETADNIDTEKKN